MWREHDPRESERDRADLSRGSRAGSGPDDKRGKNDARDASLGISNCRAAPPASACGFADAVTTYAAPRCARWLQWAHFGLCR